MGGVRRGGGREAGVRYIDGGVATYSDTGGWVGVTKST